MKTVFTNHELAHVYASNSQEQGRTSTGSFFFNDGTIYSYGRHFPIATRVNHLPNTYMMTSRTYSVSTAKHISLVRNALRHARVVYCNDPMASIAANVNDQRGKIENAYLRAANVKYPGGRGKGQIQRIAAEIHGYINGALELIKLQHELVPFANGDTTCAAMDIPAWCVPSESVLLAAQAFAEQKKQDDERLAKARAEFLQEVLKS